MTDDVEAAVRAAILRLEDVQGVLSELKSTISREIAAAEREVLDRWSDQRRAIIDAVWAAERAVLDAKKLRPSHPWEGKKVKREEVEHDRWSGRELSKNPVYGYVETYRGDTSLPATTPSWRVPQIGEAIVRRCTSKGVVGLKFERLTSNWELTND